jgi:hypothetical protein
MNKPYQQYESELIPLEGKSSNILLKFKGTNPTGKNPISLEVYLLSETDVEVKLMVIDFKEKDRFIKEVSATLNKFKFQ